MTGSSLWIDRALSSARYAPYLARAGGDPVFAQQLYDWNVSVSKEFYTPLNWMEVSLRNAVHDQLAAKWVRPDWWNIAPLDHVGQGAVSRARAKVKRQVVSADDVVAQLSFGFWVSLFSAANDRAMWVPCLHKAFPHYRGPRKILHRELNTIRLFRNRVMHHEPIHHRHLEADHRTMLRVLGYISADAVAHLVARDTVPATLASRPVRTAVR
ncbi:hypothetical protein [Nocardia mangyaensis]|uniref:hypothetical protein n=1 Tax=Nocardia mangyaensis TaxID=2213200 RepID=UPI0026759906|nr:hypothetical protein [Nocardia mangyaensis]MDO3648946.1 hypothetical protein [Nocardia mangyaensis]